MHIAPGMVLLGPKRIFLRGPRETVPRRWFGYGARSFLSGRGYLYRMGCLAPGMALGTMNILKQAAKTCTGKKISELDSLLLSNLVGN